MRRERGRAERGRVGGARDVRRPHPVDEAFEVGKIVAQDALVHQSEAAQRILLRHRPRRLLARVRRVVREREQVLRAGAER